MNLEINESIAENRIPEGIQKLKLEENLFIWGSNYADKIINEIEKYDVKVDGIVGNIDFLKSNLQETIFCETEVRAKRSRISIIVGFSWSKNLTLLADLCNDDLINHIYILEGAEYAWRMMYDQEVKLFKHQKMIFIDSYYKGLLKRGLDYNYYKANEEKFVETFQMLEDELSKETMIQYLNGHIKLSTFPMEKVRDNSPQYYNKDIIKLSDEEVFVDCGAFDGDSILQFVQETSGKYKKIIALEPDEKMLEKLYDNISNLEKTRVLKVGAYNQAGKIGFSAENCGTISSQNIDYYINVDMLDNVIPEENVTFLKMDIEGAELSALEGAQKIIRKNRPTLAICVYHKAEDLITIPQFIKNLVPEYKLYLRGYFDYCSEVVLYAVL